MLNSFLIQPSQIACSLSVLAKAMSANDLSISRRMPCPKCREMITVSFNTSTKLHLNLTATHNPELVTLHNSLMESDLGVRLQAQSNTPELQARPDAAAAATPATDSDSPFVPAIWTGQAAAAAAATAASALRKTSEQMIGYGLNADEMYECDGCGSSFPEEFQCWQHIVARESCRLSPEVAAAVEEYLGAPSSKKKKKSTDKRMDP